MENNNTTLLRIKQVSAKTGLAVSTIWKYVKIGTFPQPHKLSMRVTVWTEADIETWISSQLEGAS